MKCPNCGNELAQNANFCPSCGLTLDREVRRQPTQAIPKRPVVAALVVIGVLIVIAGLLALFRGKQPVVQSPTVSGPSSPIVQSPVSPTAPQQPLTQSEIPTAPTVPHAPPPEQAPPEVIQYLEFVKQIDDQRTNMNIDVNLAIKDPRKAMDDYAQHCNQLVTVFDSRQAPEPCRSLAGAYRQALGTYVSTVTSLLATIASANSAQNTPLTEEELKDQSLNSMLAQMVVPNAIKTKYAKSQGNIDGSFVQADQQLDQILARYHLPRTFAIKADTESGTLLGH